MEGTGRDYRGEPNAMEKAAFEFKGSPIEDHLKKKRNHITIDDVAEYLDEMGINTADANNEDFFEEVLDTIVNNGGRIIDDQGFDLDDYRRRFPNLGDEGLTKLAKMEYEGNDDDETMDKVRMAYFDLLDGGRLSKGMNNDNPIEEDDEDDSDEDDEVWDELMEGDLEDQFDALMKDGDEKDKAETKSKPDDTGHVDNPAIYSDKETKDVKKPCADEPGSKKEIASDEKCKDVKKPCTEDKGEDMTRFSDESLKNIIGVLADRIL